MPSPTVRSTRRAFLKLGAAAFAAPYVITRSKALADDADARQVAAQTRHRKPRVLKKFDARLDARRTRRNDVHVFGDERSLLRGGGQRAREGEHERAIKAYKVRAAKRHKNFRSRGRLVSTLALCRAVKRHHSASGNRAQGGL